MSSVEFLRARLIGTRFSAGTMPLEVLKDLALLQEMFIEVARWHYLQANPERRRAPKGFANAVSLNLRSVETGSTIIGIDLESSVEDLPLLQNNLPYQPYFEQARSAILSVISSAELNEPATVPFNREHYGFFNRLGQTLRQGEKVEFLPPSTDSGATLDTQVRRRLSMQSRSARNFRQEMSINGFVPAADQDAKTFDLQLVDGRKVQAPIREEHWEPLLQAFNDYRSEEGCPVRVSGVVLMDWNEVLIGIESVTNVEPLDPLDITVQLEQLKLLPDGWYDGDGHRFDPARLDWLTNILEGHFSRIAPLPRLYPMIEGGIRAEWRIGDKDISLDFDLLQETAYWHNYDLNSRESDDRDLDLNNHEHLEWVVNQFPEDARE